MAAVEIFTRRRTRTFTPSPSLIDLSWRLLPLAFVAIIVSRWFEPGRFIGNGDVAPMIRDGFAAETGSFWNHQLSGAGATTADSGRVMEVVLIRLTEILGGSELHAQRLMFIGVLAFACFGLSHLARIVLEHRPAILLAGLIGVFNPFVLLQLPNLIFPLAIGTIGTLLGEVIGFIRGRRTSVYRIVVGSLPLTYLSVNPPLIAVVFVVIAAVLAIAVHAVRPTFDDVKPVLFAVPVLCVVHAFWIVPSVVVYGRGAEGVSFAAVIDAQQWSWVYAENRLDRVATLTAHWGWFSVEYFPWSARLDGAPWSIMRWALPVGALLGGVLQRPGKRKLGLLLLGFALFLIVVSQGLHAPFSGFNQVLYDHVPGWWLFRDPISKFGPLLVMVYALLFGLLVDRVAEFSPVRGLGDAAMPCVALLALVAIVHPWPLFNGDVIASDRSTLPSSHVAVPDDWAELSALVSSSPIDGKVAVLPLNNYYQVTTTWGYHGVDLVNQFFDRPVLQRFPGGYFGEVRGFDDLLESIGAAVLAGESEEATRSLDAVGASHLVIRRDVLDPKTDPELFMQGAEQISGLELVASTDVAWLFARPDARPIRAESYTVSTVIGTEALAVERGLGAVVASSTISDRSLWTASSGTEVEMALSGEELRVRFDDAEQIDVSFHLSEGLVIGRLADEVRLDGVLVSDRIVLSLDPRGDEVDALGIGGAVVPFSDGMVTTVGAGETVDLLIERRVDVQNPGVLSDCNRKDDRTLDELGFREERTDRSILLSTELHSACVAFTLEAGDGPAQLIMTTEALSGAPARVCGWSEAKQACVVSAMFAQQEPLTTTFDLSAQDRIGPIDLFVYADGEVGERSASRYSDIELISVETIDQAVFDADHALDGLVSERDIQSLEVDIARTELLEAFGPVGDCHRVDDRTPEEIGLGGEVVGADVTLWADAHSACVDGRISAQPGETLLVSFDHTSSGALPRLCLWQSTVDACASAPAVEDGLRYRAEIETDPAATELSLFLYADGSAEGTTVTFEDIGVVRSNAPRVVVESEGIGTRLAPDVVLLGRSPSRFDMEVSDVQDSFVLVVPESYAPGWQLDGVPDGWAVEHLRVDGYANGWRIVPIGGPESAQLSASYKPASMVERSNHLSLLALALVLAHGVSRSSLGRERRRKV